MTSLSQPIHGILLLNKPEGFSSNAVLQKAKRLFSAKKAGHTGSLDPMATGMLPVCFGEATKWSQYLLDADKCYEVTACLGMETDTGDATGVTTARCESVDVSERQLSHAFMEYQGCIQQVPPMYSALKHQGTPLYKLARAGVEIERSAREVTIYELNLNQFDGQYFDFTVLCSKGTYIRSLVESIGAALGVGAHVTRLHRVYTAGFAKASMVTLEQLAQMTQTQRCDCLLPMDMAVSSFPSIILEKEAVLALRQGKVLSKSTLPKEMACYRLFDKNEQFIGLGELSAEGVLKVRRLISAYHG